MPDDLRHLPSLDFLKGFAVVARTLSFTRAAEEMCITQSAVSRQIRALEDQLGVRLFYRRPRMLLLTDEGQLLYRTVIDVLRQIREVSDKIRGGRSDERSLTVTTTAGFATLWLIPRLTEFTRTHPDVDVRISASAHIVNLERERMDLAIRNVAADSVPSGAMRLFSEVVFPVCSPALLQNPDKPLREPADLQNQVLLHFDDPEARMPWLSWSVWLETARLPQLVPGGALRFSQYEQVIQAAAAGHGVALGRSGLVGQLLKEGGLAAPFGEMAFAERGYFVVVSSESAHRPQVKDFAAWLVECARRESALPGGHVGNRSAPPAARSKRKKG